jgi:hypothetical protein
MTRHTQLPPSPSRLARHAVPQPPSPSRRREPAPNHGTTAAACQLRRPAPAGCSTRSGLAAIHPSSARPRRPSTPPSAPAPAIHPAVVRRRPSTAPSAAVHRRQLSPASADNPSLRPPQISRPAVPCSPTVTAEQQDGDGGGLGEGSARQGVHDQRPPPSAHPQLVPAVRSDEEGKVALIRFSLRFSQLQPEPNRKNQNRTVLFSVLIFWEPKVQENRRTEPMVRLEPNAQG